MLFRSTGVFDDDRYFDVVVEYAKAGPEDVLMRVCASFGLETMRVAGRTRDPPRSR